MGTKKTVNLSREDFANQIANGWNSLREIKEALGDIEEQFKRGTAAGPHGDATFTLGQSLTKLEEKWTDGRTIIKKMRGATKARLKTKANSI